MKPGLGGPKEHAPIAALRRRALELRAPSPSDIDKPWAARLATLLLIATVLFMLIGPDPYQHEQPLDPETGAAILSPAHRYAWFVLTGLAAPVLWLHRSQLADLFKRLWPLLILFGWFIASTAWALEPPTSQRRLFLLICQTAIGIACVLGLGRAKAMHRALAIACAIIVLIDLASWILLPGISQTDLGLAAIHNHKNTLGLAMMFAEFVCAPYVFTQKTWRGRLFWAFIVVSGAALLIASHSKTSINITVAAFAATPPLLAILGVRRAVLLSILTGALAALTAAALVWLSISYLHGRDPLEPIRGVTFTQRTDVWQFVLSRVALRPMTGVGFSSFWDINPMIQPSLQTDLWFAQPDSPTNEAHDGYLDLLVTTGFIGLGLSLFVVWRWVLRGLLLLRRTLRSTSAETRAGLPYLTFLCFFPILIALHNFLESSYFNTVGLFSFMVVMMGVDVDWRYPQTAPWARPRLAIAGHGPAAA